MARWVSFFSPLPEAWAFPTISVVILQVVQSMALGQCRLLAKQIEDGEIRSRLGQEQVLLLVHLRRPVVI